MIISRQALNDDRDYFFILFYWLIDWSATLLLLSGVWDVLCMYMVQLARWFIQICFLIDTEIAIPHVTEQINTRTLHVREELKKYDHGPPLEEENMGPFLSKVRALRIKHINSICLSIYPWHYIHLFLFNIDRLTDWLRLFSIIDNNRVQRSNQWTE